MYFYSAGHEHALAFLCASTYVILFNGDIQKDTLN